MNDQQFFPLFTLPHFPLKNLVASPSRFFQFILLANTHVVNEARHPPLELLTINMHASTIPSPPTVTSPKYVPSLCAAFFIYLRRVDDSFFHLLRVSICPHLSESHLLRKLWKNVAFLIKMFIQAMPVVSPHLRR